MWSCFNRHLELISFILTKNEWIRKALLTLSLNGAGIQWQSGLRTPKHYFFIYFFFMKSEPPSGVSASGKQKEVLGEKTKTLACFSPGHMSVQVSHAKAHVSFVNFYSGGDSESSLNTSSS